MSILAGGSLNPYTKKERLEFKFYEIEINGEPWYNAVSHTEGISINVVAESYTELFAVVADLLKVYEEHGEL
jgi:hypothetical protein